MTHGCFSGRLLQAAAIQTFKLFSFRHWLLLCFAAAAAVPLLRAYSPWIFRVNSRCLEAVWWMFRGRYYKSKAEHRVICKSHAWETLLGVANSIDRERGLRQASKPLSDDSLTSSCLGLVKLQTQGRRSLLDDHIVPPTRPVGSRHHVYSFRFQLLE